MSEYANELLMELSQFAQEMAVEACEIRILHKILIKISIFQLWCIFVRVELFISLFRLDYFSSSSRTSPSKQ